MALLLTPGLDPRLLVGRLESLKQMLQQEKNRLSTACKVTTPFLKRMIKTIERQITQVQEAIKTHIKNNPDLHEKSCLLATIPGIGDETINQILAYLGNLEHFQSAREMAAYVGLTPKQQQSGSSVNAKARMSKIGPGNLRKAFYFPAIVAKKYNPVIQKFCDQLAQKGKPPMVIIGAAMRKLIHIIYGVLKSGKPFNPNLCSN